MKADTSDNGFIVLDLSQPKLVQYTTTLLLLFVCLWLSREILSGSEYSPFWPVTGIAFILACFPSLIGALSVIPLVLLWGITYFDRGEYNHIVLSAIGAIVPIFIGRVLYLKLKTREQFPKLFGSASSFVAYLLCLLFVVSLPSALFSSTIVNSLGHYPSATMGQLFSLYWLSEFAGCVLFCPIAIMQLQKSRLLSQPPSALSYFSVVSLIGIAGVAMLLPGLYKQVAIFVGVPLLTFYALLEKNPYHTQVIITFWAIMCLFIAAQVPVAEGEFNDVLYLAGMSIMLVGCCLTFQVVWLISERRRFLTSELERKSRIDMRTHLLNDRGVADALQQLPAGRYQAVIVRLHQSRDMIESLGITQFPLVLSEIAARITSLFGRVEICGLINGAAIIAVISESESERLNDMNRLSSVLTKQSYLSDQSLSITDMDIAALSFEASESQSLVEKLNVAAYLASLNPIHRCFSGSVNSTELDSPTESFKHFQAIKKKLDQNRLVMWGQPIKYIASDSLPDKIELLARINDESGEIIYPDGFLPLFEKFGFQAEFDKYVLKSSFAILAGLADSQCCYSINVSARSFAQYSFPDFVASLLAQYQVNPAICAFELTETDSLPNIESTIRNVQRLNEMGFEVGLDDFGTGFANYSYLLDIPFNFVKIDGRFIKNIDVDETSVNTVRAVVSAAKSANMKTVAEFVESASILTLLRDMGVDFAQGYGVGKPSPLSNTPS